MLPVKKTSKSKKRGRRSHLALRPPNLAACPSCGNVKLPHCACSTCGYVSPKQSLPVAEEES